jgi:hypothetical protein
MKIRSTPHEVIAESGVDEILRRKIKQSLFDKTLTDNVDLVVFLITNLHNTRNDDQIDITVEKLIKEWHAQTSE